MTLTSLWHEIVAATRWGSYEDVFAMMVVRW
jgi:hypothetical protein